MVLATLTWILMVVWKAVIKVVKALTVGKVVLKMGITYMMKLVVRLKLLEQFLRISILKRM